MKTIIPVALLAFFSVTVSSCSKSDLTEPVAATPVNTDPVIDSKIYHFVSQPSFAELGTPAAMFHQGDSVTIFLPYVLSYDSLINASITMTDDATGLPINTYEMVSYTDSSAANLVLPAGLVDRPPFMFVTFIADENYTGKTVSITTSLTGNATSSTDSISGAFSVQP